MKKCIVITCILLFSISANAERIVVLPFSDLSTGDVNSVNLEITKLFIKTLKYSGFDTIPLERIIEFLSRNKIRWTGFIDSFTCARIFEKFKATKLLVGTVTEWENSEKPKIGITIQLLSLPSGRPIWGDVFSMSYMSKIGIFGMGKPFSIKDFSKEIVFKAVSSIPLEVGKDRNLLPRFKVRSFFISPRFTKSGETVSCTIAIDVLDRWPDNAFLEIKNFGIVPLSKEEGKYTAYFKAPSKDGRYPITLVLRWGEKTFRTFLSSLFVDNIPPKLKLKFRKGIDVNGIRAFKNCIVILPKLEDPEPTVRWRVDIRDEKGNLIATGGIKGSLPRRVVWKGVSASGVKINRGLFTVTLRVWDRAGNEGVAESKVIIERTPPAVDVLCSREGGEVFITLREREKREVPISLYILDIYDIKGNLLKKIQGSKLPYKEKLEGLKVKKLAYSITVEDILGNRFKVGFKRLKIVTRRRKKKEKKGIWLEEF